MVFFKRGYVALALLIPLWLVSPAYAGLVDFSENLLNMVRKQFSGEAVQRLMVWKRLLTDLKTAEAVGARQSEPRAESLTLRKANDFFNQVPYVIDQINWGREDYWATPIEMLGHFAGDCEDYSIAKYLSLKELGIPIERLRITYVQAKSVNEPHMVLAYYPRPDAEPYILDNLQRDVRLASQRPDLEPVYSFNDDDVWTANGMTRKGGASQVRLWRDLLDKLAREGRL